MANKRKGHLTSTSEWAKHLRKYLKRQFWKGERNASKVLVRKFPNEFKKSEE
jgi:hypothetical protein